MISSKIKKLRKALNLSQVALAKLLGVSQTTISHLELQMLAGSDKMRERLDKLAKKHNISINFM